MTIVTRKEVGELFLLNFLFCMENLMRNQKNVISSNFFCHFLFLSICTWNMEVSSSWLLKYQDGFPLLLTILNVFTYVWMDWMIFPVLFACYEAPHVYKILKWIQESLLSPAAFSLLASSVCEIT